MEVRTPAATSRSLMLRAEDARRRIVIASFWLHRFWAMMMPIAISMVVLDSMADFRSDDVLACFETRSTICSALAAWAAKPSASSCASAPAPGASSGVAEFGLTVMIGVPVVTAFQVCRLIAVLLLVDPTYRLIYAPSVGKPRG